MLQWGSKITINRKSMPLHEWQKPKTERNIELYLRKKNENLSYAELGRIYEIHWTTVKLMCGKGKSALEKLSTKSTLDTKKK